MKRMKNIRLGTLVACMCVLWGCEKPNVNIVMPQEASNRVLFAGEHLKKALEDAGYSSVMLSDTAGMDKDEVCIRLEQAADTAGLKKEGFTISTRGNMTTVTGNDGSGVIYGCRELIDPFPGGAWWIHYQPCGRLFDGVPRADGRRTEDVRYRCYIVCVREQIRQRELRQD